MSLNLADRDRCFVIAEAGTAHLGNEHKAHELVRAAKVAGADAVKFQWFTRDPQLFCGVDGDGARVPRWKLSALTVSQWERVKRYADALGITFLASAFEKETVAWLGWLELEATKVASRAAKTFPYDMAGLPRPFIISDGMGLPQIWNGNVSFEGTDWLMQCEAKYPSTQKWKGAMGFSDHSGKPFLSIDAIARGCPLLEVHFMINPIDAGPDLPACLTLDELKLVCEARDYHAERKNAA